METCRLKPGPSLASSPKGLLDGHDLPHRDPEPASPTLAHRQIYIRLCNETCSLSPAHGIYSHAFSHTPRWATGVAIWDELRNLKLDPLRDISVRRHPVTASIRNPACIPPFQIFFLAGSVSAYCISRSPLATGQDSAFFDTRSGVRCWSNQALRQSCASFEDITEHDAQEYCKDLSEFH